WRVLVEKFAALTVALALILALTGLGFLLGMAMTPTLTLPVGRLIEGVYNILPGTLFLTALALLFSTILPSRQQAAGVTITIVVVSYLVAMIGLRAGASEFLLRVLRTLSFYRYYNGIGVLLNGLNWGNTLVLYAATALVFALAVAGFQRRDLLPGHG
ncbi:MAG: ABC transporter permease subunit, partial [Anaerolineae bacterium]|nr:ABC transporter permease subunit [Anaerolineae bacterium]